MSLLMSFNELQEIVLWKKEIGSTNTLFQKDEKLILQMILLCAVFVA